MVIMITKLRGLPTSQREELPLQREGHNIHDDFVVVVLKNNYTVSHVPQESAGVSCRRVAVQQDDLYCNVIY